MAAVQTPQSGERAGVKPDELHEGIVSDRKETQGVEGGQDGNVLSVTEEVV